MTTRRANRWIMGSALGLAAFAVALDHTRHRLPEMQPPAGETAGAGAASSPCGLGTNPCGLGQAAPPCGLGTSPCGLDDGDEAPPCGLGPPASPCSL
ncbi:MAG TPA: hypothetical protein ENK20_12125 [Chromatiales bacterium]|nr:hypothetical protein [Chromatiales bacterium]